MTDELNINNFFTQIEEDLFVVKIDNLEDFRAVLSSKVSRELFLHKKANLTSENLEKFLSQNLAKYNHASIAEMCCLTIYHFGFGWVSSFLLVDDPLFIGQEVSSRAVDIFKRDDTICYDAQHLPNIQENFNFFKNIFLNLKTKFLIKNSYCFDYIRWALPGSIRTGVIYDMNGRVLSRHLNRLKYFSFLKKVIQKYETGFKAIAPNVYKSVMLKSRKNINIPKVIPIINKDLNSDDVQVKWILKPKNLSEIVSSILESSTPNITNKREYLPSSLNQLGLFKFTIHCSIAAARDWHRHRAVMPWTLKLLKWNNVPLLSLKYKDFGLKELSSKIYDFFNKTIPLNNRNFILWDELYLLPFGAMVEMQCYATLDKLFYMLKLRSSSANANFEY